MPNLHDNFKFKHYLKLLKDIKLHFGSIRIVKNQQRVSIWKICPLILIEAQKKIDKVVNDCDFNQNIALLLGQRFSLLFGFTLEEYLKNIAKLFSNCCQVIDFTIKSLCQNLYNLGQSRQNQFYNLL